MTFRVRVEGSNVLVVMEGQEPNRCGFFVTAHLEAPNADETEALVMAQERSLDSLRALVRHQADDRPLLRIDDIRTLDEWPVDGHHPLAGLSWFKESEGAHPPGSRGSSL